MPLGQSCFLSVEIFKIPPKKTLFSLLFQRFLRFPSQPSSLSVLSQMRSHPFRLIEVVLGGTRWYFIKLSPLNIGCNWRQTKIRLHKKINYLNFTSINYCHPIISFTYPVQKMGEGRLGQFSGRNIHFHFYFFATSLKISFFCVLISLTFFFYYSCALRMSSSTGQPLSFPLPPLKMNGEPSFLLRNHLLELSSSSSHR